MRIVALVPGDIGDQILFFPTLDDLKQSYPNAQIDVVVEPRAKAAYQVSKSVQQTLLFDYQDRNSLADLGNLLGMLREREYEVALAFQRNWTVNFLLWMTGIPTRVGFAGSPGQMFLTRTVPPSTQTYIAAARHDLLTALDLDLPCAEVALSLPQTALDWADAERKKLGIGNGGYVMLYCLPSYPADSWRGIIQDFQQRQPELPLVLLKDAASETMVQNLASGIANLKVTTPATVGQMAAMIAGANLLIASESTAMQLAVAVKTFTLALFGDTDPKQVLPASDRFVGIKSLTGQVADISPQTVLEKVWGS